MERMSSWVWKGAVVLGLIASVSAAAPRQASAEATFSKDIAPILQEKCQVCHRVNQMAPMSLVTYVEVRPWARAIKNRVLAREMPPWHLDQTVGIQHFINDASLTDQEIETIVSWVDAGAPRGNPADMPPPVDWHSSDHFFLEAKLGPPDMIIRGTPWTMPAKHPDVTFSSAELELPEITEPRWVRASETKPSLVGRRIAHHGSLHIIRPQTPEAIEAETAVRAGQPGADVVLAARRSNATLQNELFTEWAQGKGGELYPEDVGKLVMPGTKAQYSIHYHAVGEEVTDVMESGWWLYPDGETPRYSAEFVPVGCVHCLPDDRLQIPPHTVAQHQGWTVLQAPAMLHNFQPHMHYLGSAMILEAVYPNGRRELVNQVLRYNNDWHINYVYDPDYAPVFPKGTVLLVTAMHDNTDANRNNPDPRQWVSGGGRTVDEMAHLNEQVIYLTEEDYDRIVKEREQNGALTQN